MQGAGAERVVVSRLNVGPLTHTLVTGPTITINSSLHNLTAGSKQDVTTINGGLEGDLLWLIGDSKIKLKGGGNIGITVKLDPSIALMLIYLNGVWSPVTS